mgnify:CR=1 FL=1
MNRRTIRRLADVVEASRAYGCLVTAGDVSLALRLSRDAARRRLAALRDLGMARPVGRERDGSALWEVTP